MTYQRITNNYINENVLNNLLTNRTVLMELQKKIASGKEIDRGSDDVFSAISILSSNSSLGKIDSYLNNINTAKSELETADRAILTAVDATHKARELTIMALNATSGDEELKIIGNQIDQLINQVKDIGNTKYGSKFIFGGKTTSAAPFTSPVDGEVEYIGSPEGSHERNIEISEGITVAVNLSGDAVFGYYYEDPPGTVNEQGLIATLTKLKNELNNANPDKELIRERLGDLDTDLATLLNTQSSVGCLLARLDITTKIHENNQISLTDIKSGAQDIDFTKTISDLKFQETALQASLKVSARILQPSLMNYL